MYDNLDDVILSDRRKHPIPARIRPILFVGMWSRQRQGGQRTLSVNQILKGCHCESEKGKQFSSTQR